MSAIFLFIRKFVLSFAYATYALLGGIITVGAFLNMILMINVYAMLAFIIICTFYVAGVYYFRGALQRLERVSGYKSSYW